MVPGQWQNTWRTPASSSYSHHPRVRVILLFMMMRSRRRRIWSTFSTSIQAERLKRKNLPSSKGLGMGCGVLRIKCDTSYLVSKETLLDSFPQ